MKKWESIRGAMKWFIENIWKYVGSVHPLGKLAIGVAVFFVGMKVMSLLMKMIFWLIVLCGVIAGIHVVFYIATQTLRNKEDKI
ncbi:MAG: hypothetical protein ACP5UA_05080 [Candidatus Hydrogenedens sp.]